MLVKTYAGVVQGVDAQKITIEVNAGDVQSEELYPLLYKLKKKNSKG